MSDPARILIIDDHPVVRKGIRSLLSNYPQLEVVAEAGTRKDAIAAFGEHSPDVVLLDIRLGDEAGLEVLDQLLDMDPDARVLMLSSFDDEEYVTRSLRAGALGYILKGDSDAVLATAIETVAAGGRALGPEVTHRLVEQLFGNHDSGEDEMDELDLGILEALAEGDSNRDIARRLFMSDSTVKRRIRSIFDHLGVNRRPEAVAEAIRRGLV